LPAQNHLSHNVNLDHNPTRAKLNEGDTNQGSVLSGLFTGFSSYFG